MSRLFSWLGALNGWLSTDKLPSLAYKPNAIPTTREVAFAYLFGDGVEQDFGKALKWFGRQPSENCFFIGACHYRLGQFGKAVKWFKKEVAREAYGSQMTMAAQALTECYRNGIGVKANAKKSMEYGLLETNAGGTARDAYWSGICSLFGLGVRQDKAEGLRLLEVAAEQGEDWAWLHLGKFYLHGEADGGRDVGKAIDCLKRVVRMPELAAYYLAEAQNAKKA